MPQVIWRTNLDDEVTEVVPELSQASLIIVYEGKRIEIEFQHDLDDGDATILVTYAPGDGSFDTRVFELWDA